MMWKTMRMSQAEEESRGVSEREETAQYATTREDGNDYEG